MTPPLLRALAVGAALALCAPSLARPQAPAAPVFVGAAARSPAGQGLAAKVEDALGKALSAEDVVDLTRDPEAEAGPKGRVEDLDRLLSDARGRYLEGDFAGALAQTKEALGRFEEGFAYEPDEAAWRVWTELMLVRALAEGRLGHKGEDGTLAQLAAARPDYVPDPGLAPPKVASRYRAIQQRLGERPASLEVTTRPAGAEILLDGRPVGLTPQTLTGLLPGRHFVSLRLGAQRWTKRVDLEPGGDAIAATLDDPRRVPADALRSRFAGGLSEAELVRLAADVDAEVLLALIEPAASEVRVLVGRVRKGALVAVTAASVRDDLSDLEDASVLLARTALEATGDGFAAGAKDARDLRARFLGAAGAPGGEAEDGAGLALVAGGALAASVLVVGAAAAITALLLNQPPNPGGTDLLIDASNL